MARPDLSSAVLSVVIPVHNEVESVPVLWRELREVLVRLERRAEVVFVDDGSTDGSDKAIRDIVTSDPRARSVRLRTRSGLTAAFHAGYAAATGDVIVTLDGDLQSDPRDIPALLAELSHADAAIGWRRRRHDTMSKRLASRIANAVRRRVLGDSFRDSACSLRAMRRPCLAALPPYDGMHRFVPGLLTMNGFVVVEVPVTHRPRRHGRSKFGIVDRGVRASIDMLVVRWMRARRLRHEIEE